MVGLAFAIAASTNFPVLFLSINWKYLTTNGAYYGGMLGLIFTVLLVILGPTIWVDIFQFHNPVFPYKYPALFSVTFSFFSIMVISKIDKNNNSKDNINKFSKMINKAYLGKK